MNQFPNLTKFKGINDFIASSKESTGNSWCDMAIEIHKISPLDIPTQILIRGKVLDNCVFNTLEYFCQTNKYNEIGWLLLIALDKVGKERVSGLPWWHSG